MIRANGELRKHLAIAFATALVAAIGTKLGELAIERVRAAVEPKPAAKEPPCAP